MRLTYYSIALLVLYGDLLKRVLSADTSLLVLYMLSLGILFFIAIRGKLSSRHMSSEGRLINIAAAALLLLYVLQLLTSFSAPNYGLSHALYMGIPLLYLWVLQRFSPEFNLAEFGNIFLLLMIPINIIGLIQNFFDPDFFISTAYTEDDMGGVILRNLLGGGFFARYPSLFVSADRYSAMGLMQLYFTLVAMKNLSVASGRNKLWLVFNALCGLAALLIAGARSRILIASAASLMMMLTVFFAPLFTATWASQKKAIGTSSLLLPVIMLAVWISIALLPPSDSSTKVALPVLTFLSQSSTDGDFGLRVAEAIEVSLVPDNISFFGEGLGSVGNGKPGEFGIQSMWTESGLFWGGPMLIAFLTIAGALIVRMWKCFLLRDPIGVAIFAVPMMLVVFALLAGFTSTFELSTGVLFGCAVAVTLRARGNVIRRPSY